jgi:hypothetical protein
MKIFGTIDGVFGDDGAGSVGLKPPGGSDKIINIAWKPAYRKYGYHGGHTDSTSAAFVEHVLSKHITYGEPVASESRDERHASAPATDPQVASRD